MRTNLPDIPQYRTTATEPEELVAIYGSIKGRVVIPAQDVAPFAFAAATVG